LSRQIYVIVGGNGSGKSTFYYRYLAKTGIPFLNADELAKEKWPNDPEAHSYEAAKLVEEERLRLITLSKNFCFETVFSHPSKVDFLALAKSKGYVVNLIVIHICSASPDTNIARVTNRLEHGGHHVPSDKITSRIPRMLDNVTKAIPLCDTVSFYDNTSTRKPFQRIAILTNNHTLHCDQNIPVWVAKCISNNYSNKIPFNY
jgi:predicted ABC-type ATPase